MPHEMDEHFRRALSVVAEGEIFRTDIGGNYVFAQRNHRLIDKVDLPPSVVGDNPSEKEVEESEKKAEAAMVDSAEFGAPSVSSLAREELLVVEAQVNEARMETGPTEEKPSSSPPVADPLKAPLSLTNAVTNAAVRIRDAIRGAVTGSSSSADRWTDRAKEEKGTDLKGVVCR